MLYFRVTNVVTLAVRFAVCSLNNSGRYNMEQVLKSKECKWVAKHIDLVHWVQKNTTLVTMIRDRKFPLLKFSSEVYAADLIPDNWSVFRKEDTGLTLTDGIPTLKPCPVVLEDDEFKSISTKTMRERAKKCGACWSLADGRRMLAEPRKLVKFCGFIIPLPGTILINKMHGSLKIACLRLNRSGQWGIEFREVGGFDSWYDDLCRFASK